MNEKTIVLLEKDLMSISFGGYDAHIANIVYSDRFHRLIREWIRNKALDGPILADEYISFNNDIKNMLLAEISMMRESSQANWLIKEVRFI